MAANATGGSGGQSAFNNQVANLTEFADTGVQPFVEVTYTSATQGGGQTQTIKTNISGSQTKSMTVRSDTVGIQQVKCLIKHPNAALNYFQGRFPSANESSGILDGGLLTNPANFEAISAANLTQSTLKVELVRDDDVNVFGDAEYNLFLGSLDIQGTDQDFNMTRTVTVYAPAPHLPIDDVGSTVAPNLNVYSVFLSKVVVNTHTPPSPPLFPLKLCPADPAICILTARFSSVGKIVIARVMSKFSVDACKPRAPKNKFCSPVAKRFTSSSLTNSYVRKDC